MSHQKRLLWFYLPMFCVLYVPQNAVSAESSLIEPSETAKRPGTIKIATIGSLPPAIGFDQSYDMVIQHVIDHWKNRFARVLPDQPDLIVVPESCDLPLGFPMNRQLAYFEARGDRVLNYFAKVAKENHCYITYSSMQKSQDDGTWHNCIVLLDRTGDIAGIYSKNHPTIIEIEMGILPGTNVRIVECDFGRVAMIVCFDLNFDALRAQIAKAKPDLILFCSMYHGGLMQPYWAYSCRSHFVGAIEPKSPSEIYSPSGAKIASTTNYFAEVVATVNLDCALAHLDYNWDRLKALKEKYGPTVTITDPGQLGSVLITSSHESIGVEAMLDEFQIERLDDYLNRALQYRSESIATTTIATKTFLSENPNTPSNKKAP